MKILLATATTAEIQPLLMHLNLRRVKEGTVYKIKNGEHKLSIIITGVGMMNTAYQLGKIFTAGDYNFAINAGIAGSFSKDISIGAIVNINREIFADLGAENDTRYLDIFELGLMKENQFPFKNGILENKSLLKFNSIKKLRKVKGISVNKVHGSTNSILSIRKKYKPEVESMEGAAFHYACLKEKIPYSEIRSISNYIEKRDRSKWNIPQAIINLNDFLMDLFKVS
jgi:futalosine hydrolase